MRLIIAFFKEKRFYKMNTRYIKSRIKDLYLWLRFGKITSRVEERINGVVSQEIFYDKDGKIVGYWAYGYYAPNLPYKG